MIACDNTDLFGGRISTVASVEFCCQIETAGEGLHLAPVTSVHDLTHPGVSDVHPVVVLHYDTIWHAINISVPHKLIVNFLESLAAGDNRISLRQALDMASLKFGYFGTWKWTSASPAEFAAKHHHDPKESLFTPGAPARTFTVPASAFSERYVDFHGHSDSPLAD